jgi:hypothetical protein
MSFECVFKYFERGEDGKYNTEEKKTLTKSVGKKGEDTDLDQCAKVILAQLARRDVWVVDVEICEFVRKQVSFKETKGGIIVKNRKYVLDSGEITSEPFIETKIADLKQLPIKEQQFQKPPLRYEVFRPNREDLAILLKNGTKLTLGRKYPIFEEKIKSGSDLFYYITQDDTGTRIELNSLFFEPERKGLIGMGAEASYAIDGSNLSYVNSSSMNMPNLRGI